MARFLTARPLVLIVAAVLLAGCGQLTRSTEAAADAMDLFHERFNAGDYDKVYDTADADFQAATTRADFLKLLAAIQRKLGDYKTCASQGWSTNTIGIDTRVTLRYKTTFSKATGDEEFVYRTSGTRATLLGYHINSNALITD